MTLPYVAVIGAGDVAEGSPEMFAAEAVGWGLATAGATVVCGGLAGVMAGACRGAAAAGGMSIGLLPGSDRADANEWVSVVIPTGLGEGRNLLVIKAAQGVVAVGGGYGTLTEMGLALRGGVPIVGLDTWDLSRRGVTDEGVVRVGGAPEAVVTVLRLIDERAFED